jgi:membrane protein DedA with SNARE-associated domain
MENAVEQMQFLLNTLDKIPFLVLIIIAFAITLIENLFPPAPSDITFVAICIVVGLTQQPLVPIIISGTIGATLGF